MKRSIGSVIVRSLLSLAAIFIAYWFILPPLNLRSLSMWKFVMLCIVICIVINAFSSIVRFLRGSASGKKISVSKKSFKLLSKPLRVSLVCIGVILVFTFIGSIIGAEIFNASRYNKLLTIEDGNFTDDISELNMSQIPVVDRDTASRLGQRKLGEMADLVSQFEIQDLYTQINYKDRPVRVTPLVYGDVIKWFNNRTEGIPAYITVDMTTQETTLVRLENGIKYSTHEYLMRNVERYLRFKYPTKMFDNISFEIDENGTPYWVVSVVDYKIGIWSGRDIKGAILLNAVTGESSYYDIKDLPTWVDQAYDSYTIIEQLTYNGKYRSGFFNSIFGQKGVIQPTDGYNYLAINDDVYLYTGMTSVTGDESNVGFVLTNLRTKATKYYAVPGAEEYSAMNSAEGQVQHLKYTATFPLLLNISDRPTYFVSLKDSAGLVKMYAFVDVQQYQIVGTGNTVEAAKSDYMEKLKNEDVEISGAEEVETSGVIASISSAVVSGNTHYYILLEGNEAVYTLPISLSDRLPFATVGDSITMTVTESNEQATVISVNF